jgi:outer membrane lipoprotein SlyB
LILYSKWWQLCSGARKTSRKYISATNVKFPSFSVNVAAYCTVQLSDAPRNGEIFDLLIAHRASPPNQPIKKSIQMKKIQLLVLAAVVSATAVSCESYGPNARMGTAIGGLGGAALGGIIGHQSGRGLEGAAIGAAAGAGAGALMGSSTDQRQRQQGGYYNQQQGGYNNGYNQPQYQQQYQQGPQGYYRN